MLLRQMKYFVAVVECNGFTAAAERCYISQSAISQQISSLEGELGVSLLERDGRKISVTPAGEYFYRRSKAIIAETDEVRAETIRIGSDSELCLSIGYLAGYCGVELQNAVVDFSGIYPEVIISVFRCTHEDLYDALLNGKADLVLSDDFAAVDFREELCYHSLPKEAKFKRCRTIKTNERKPCAAEKAAAGPKRFSGDGSAPPRFRFGFSFYSCCLFRGVCLAAAPEREARRFVVRRQPHHNA